MSSWRCGGTWGAVSSPLLSLRLGSFLRQHLSPRRESGEGIYSTSEERDVLWVACLCPPKIPVEVLVPEVMVVGGGALGS